MLHTAGYHSMISIISSAALLGVCRLLPAQSVTACMTDRTETLSVILYAGCDDNGLSSVETGTDRGDILETDPAMDSGSLSSARASAGSSVTDEVNGSSFSDGPSIAVIDPDSDDDTCADSSPDDSPLYDSFPDDSSTETGSDTFFADTSASDTASIHDEAQGTDISGMPDSSDTGESGTSIRIIDPERTADAYEIGEGASTNVMQELSGGIIEDFSAEVTDESSASSTGDASGDDTINIEGTGKEQEPISEEASMFQRTAEDIG